jgi:hypothetical protein
MIPTKGKQAGGGGVGLLLTGRCNKVSLMMMSCLLLFWPRNFFMNVEAKIPPSVRVGKK